MSPPSADVFAEMYDALAAGRFVPAGDRLIEATTPLERCWTNSPVASCSPSTPSPDPFFDEDRQLLTKR